MTVQYISVLDPKIGIGRLGTCALNDVSLVSDFNVWEPFLHKDACYYTFTTANKPSCFPGSAVLLSSKMLTKEDISDFVDGQRAKNTVIKTKIRRWNMHVVVNSTTLPSKSRNLEEYPHPCTAAR